VKVSVEKDVTSYIPEVRKRGSYRVPFMCWWWKKENTGPKLKQTELETEEEEEERETEGLIAPVLSQNLIHPKRKIKIVLYS